MFNVIGRVAAFFLMLGLFVVCIGVGLMWWATANVPPNLTTPEQVKHFKFAAGEQVFITYYPVAIASAILIAALIAFKPRPLTFVLAGLVAAVFFFTGPSSVRTALSIQHELHPEYYSSLPTPLPTPTPLPGPVPPAAPSTVAAPAELAAPGVFYLLTAAHVQTADGITGLPPGTEVTLVRPGIYLTPAGKVHLDQTQLTNDLGKARIAIANDRNSQAALHVNVVTVDTITEHGVRKIPVQLNGMLTRNFVVDSGASYVSIPSAVVTELIQSRALTESDFLPGYVIFVIADGSRSKRRRFILRSVRVGETTVADVLALDAGPNSMPLLGMSFLSKAKAVYDTASGKLIFSR
jgi:gag-polyprotein putative aspartyl protease